METKTTTSKNSKEENKAVKEVFISNPMEAKERHARILSRQQILEGQTLYSGNCVLKKDSVKAMCDFMELAAPVFVKTPSTKKHDLSFLIGDIECTFAVGKGAIISCKPEEQETMRQFAELMFHPQSVHFV